MINIFNIYAIYMLNICDIEKINFILCVRQFLMIRHNIFLLCKIGEISIKFDALKSVR